MRKEDRRPSCASEEVTAATSQQRQERAGPADERNRTAQIARRSLTQRSLERGKHGNRVVQSVNAVVAGRWKAPVLIMRHDALVSSFLNREDRVPGSHLVCHLKLLQVALTWSLP